MNKSEKSFDVRDRIIVAGCFWLLIFWVIKLLGWLLGVEAATQ